MKQQTGFLSIHKTDFNNLPKIGRHKKRIQKKLLKKLGYPYFRYSRKSGFYNMYVCFNDFVPKCWADEATLYSLGGWTKRGVIK